MTLFSGAANSPTEKRDFGAYDQFAWPQGYGELSVGISQVQERVHYIEQQLEHHRSRTFPEEY
jgi:hypothetical protein